MGLLALGTPLTWDETKPLAEHIRNHGITQFLHTWDRWKDNVGKGLLWGDEVSIAEGGLKDRSNIWWYLLMIRRKQLIYHYDKLKFS
jgi:glutamate--cysteine ligase catalytic subunit